VTFLGTASGRPTRTRNVSSTAVWIRNNDAASGTKETATRREKVLMFDCGDGTLLQSLHVPHLRNLMYLEVICLTHMHGDHAFGLPTVIASACNHSSDFAPKTPLHVFGPQGVSAYVKGALAQTKTWMDRPIVYHEVLKSNVKTVSGGCWIFSCLRTPRTLLTVFFRVCL
jgi:ribonuclease Z